MNMRLHLWRILRTLYLLDSQCLQNMNRVLISTQVFRQTLLIPLNPKCIDSCIKQYQVSPMQQLQLLSIIIEVLLIKVQDNIWFSHRIVLILLMLIPLIHLYHDRCHNSLVRRVHSHHIAMPLDHYPTVFVIKILNSLFLTHRVSTVSEVLWPSGFEVNLIVILQRWVNVVKVQ